MFKCKICEKEFSSFQKLGGHGTVHTRIAKVKIKEVKNHCCRYCNKEFETGPKLGSHTRNCILHPKKKLWNKENSQRQLGIKLSEKTKAKVSLAIRKKVADGTWHYSFSKVRTHEYKGIKLHGKWELQYAKWLDENNINWRRPKEKFAYVFENKERYYTPDFYLVDTNEYIEIKGYETDKDRAKWKDFPFKLTIIKGKELKEKGIINEKQFKGLE